MITLTINGKERTLEAPTPLVDYLDSLEVNIRFIAVGHNGIVIRREEFDDVTLAEGDEVENCARGRRRLECLQLS